jgi:Patatin-like phospholipase
MDALILKGGGVKGLAFAGAARELQAHFEFQAFVGTSAGAVAASLLAAGASGEDLEGELRRKPFRDFLDGSTWAAFINIPMYGGIHPGLTLTNWIREELFRLLGKYNEVLMKDLPRRAVIYAAQANRDAITFDTRGERSDSAVHAAVRCSLSIPYFFQPQQLDGQWVYDGGMLNNFPLEIFLNQERQRCPEKHLTFIALYLGKARPPPLKRGFQFPKLLSIWIDRNDRDVIERFRSQTILIDTDPIGTIDFNLTEEEKTFLVLIGRASALEFLQGRGLLDEPQIQSLELMKAQAEKLREAIVQERTSHRSSIWRRYIATALASLAAAVAIFAAVLYLYAPVPCPARVLWPATVQKGNNGGDYRVQVDFTRGREKIDPRACGREYWAAADSTNDLSGQKWVYLLDAMGNRLSPALPPYIENSDGTLRPSDQ